MCRIAGLITKEFSINQLRHQITNMCDSMKHGGPDDFGIVVDETNFVSLGNRRLSILDLSAAGHQPMLSDDEKLVITYNGEIYNFKSLRAELIKKGCSFKTNTDTEVILKAYQYWGEDSFTKLNGIFAFCIYDKVKNIIYLVRDQSGVKPAYYHINSKYFSFASEVKAFKQSGFEEIENENWKIYYLAFGHIPEPYTTLKNVFSLPKGSFLKYNLADHSFKIHAYHEFSTTIKITNEQEAILKIRQKLDNVVESQLISDTAL